MQQNIQKEVCVVNRRIKYSPVTIAIFNTGEYDRMRCAGKTIRCVFVFNSRLKGAVTGDVGGLDQK